MVRIGLFYKSFYKELRERIWRSIGIRLYQDRNNLLLKLLSEFRTCCMFPSGISLGKDNLLDVGAYDCLMSASISEIYNLSAVCIDLSKNLKSQPRTCVFLVAEGCSLPFKPNSFSMVTSISLIEHLPEVNRQRFYDETKKVLRDDGCFILQFPNRYFPIESHSFLPFVGYLPSKFHKAFSPDFVAVPSKTTIEEELEKNGFSIVKTIEYELPFFKSLRGVFRAFFVAFPFGFLIMTKKRGIK